MTSPFASLWFFLFVAAALADWVLVGLARAGLRRVTKPAALALLIVWFAVEGGLQGAGIWFGVGLVCSLAGDIFLLRSDRFLVGLAAFFAAHLCYLAAFRAWQTPPGWPVGLLIVVMAVGYLLQYRLVITGSGPKIRRTRLFVPVALYGLVLSLMALSAMLTLLRPDWPLAAAALAAAGGALFFASDTLLAVRAYVRPLRYGDLAVMVTYHLAQGALASAFLIMLRAG